MRIGASPELAGAYHWWLRAEEGKEYQGKLGKMLSMRIFAFFSLWIWQRIGINGKRYVIPIDNKSNSSKGKSDFNCMMMMI